MRNKILTITYAFILSLIITIFATGNVVYEHKDKIVFVCLITLVVGTYFAFRLLLSRVEIGREVPEEFRIRK